MMDQLPEEIRRLLDELDRPEQTLSEPNVARQVQTRCGSGLDERPNAAVRAEIDALLFVVPTGAGEEEEPTYFRPRATGTDESGNPRCFPDRRNVTAAVIEYWRSRCQEARHPILRARYADLVWDLTREATGTPPDVCMARIAIDAYLDAVDRKLVPISLGVEQKAGRALSLALAIKDEPRITRTREVILGLDESEEDDCGFARRGLAFNLLLWKKQKVRLSDVDEGGILARQEALLTAALQVAVTGGEPRSGGGAGPVLVRFVVLRLAPYYRSRGRTEGRMVLQMAENLVWTSPYLHHILTAFYERVGTEALLAALLKSPLFAPDHITILSTGLRAYAGADWIATLHVLVPQLERSLRRLLEICHVSIYRPGRRGGFALRNLDDILREPAVEAAFGPDFVFYAKTVLTDQRGWNVRHDLAHGAMASERMNQVVADRIMHILFILGSGRLEISSGAPTA